MGSIYSKLYPSIQPYSVLMLGLDGAGKTTILNRIIHDKIDTSRLLPNAFKLVTRKYNTIVENRHFLIRSRWRYFYKFVNDGIIFVIDGCDRERFSEVQPINAKHGKGIAEGQWLSENIVVTNK
ncbi:hypothetical protein PPL_08171 [Heterostelium album PN500]|uniref:ADP-ribosylation factor n=1 Tax=Heterostelium pallidum (strain ATCC 26659 / Pp 5 / PN500) TaxID=670386 RepID=D3BIT6_HETP5|nr:hypothetical protein PPL_08171 [Heterostelium album PN500]EFA78710.1 hypothetical protein PPL_08171 [Heterostelium album PN500]|eukprot:XP_020430834.1 hypothetical protein PPL_08171 [Heterostelium album PN500]